MLRDVADRPLRDAQQRRLHLHRQLVPVSVHLDGDVDVAALGEGFCHALQGTRQGGLRERGRLQGRDHRPRLREAVRGRRTRGLHPPAHLLGIPRLQVTLCDVQQHLNAGQPLSHGVVNLMRQALPLGRHTLRVLRGRELVAGGDQFAHRLLPFAVEARQGLQRVVHGQGHRRGDRRPHDATQGDPAGHLHDDRYQGHEHHRHRAADIGHGSQEHEVQGEDQVDANGRDNQLHHPDPGEHKHPQLAPEIVPVVHLVETHEVEHRKDGAQQEVERGRGEVHVEGAADGDRQQHRRHHVQAVAHGTFVQHPIIRGELLALSGVLALRRLAGALCTARYDRLHAAQPTDRAPASPSAPAASGSPAGNPGRGLHAGACPGSCTGN